MTFSDQFIAIVNALCEKIGVVIDWTSQNVIPYIQELCTKFIRYTIITGVFEVILCIVAFIIAFKGLGWGCRTLEKSMEKDIEFLNCAAIAVCSVILLCVVFAFISNVYDIITCVVFPEKALFDYIYPLINS